jgi:cell division protein ZapA
MPGRTVHLRVGGQTYRVVTSASDEELQRLAAVVDAKIAAVVPPGRMVTPQAMLLAAIALAHDLEEERSRSEAVKTRARSAYGRLLERVDAALGEGALSAGSDDAARTSGVLPAATPRPSLIPGPASVSMGPSQDGVPYRGPVRPANES